LNAGLGVSKEQVPKGRPKHSGSIVEYAEASANQTVSQRARLQRLRITGSGTLAGNLPALNSATTAGPHAGPFIFYCQRPGGYRRHIHGRRRNDA